MGKDNPDHSWITFIDSDDLIHPNYLEHLYRSANDAKVDISVCRYIRTSTPENETVVSVPLEYCTLSPEAFWHKDRTNATIAWGKLYRMCCFSNVLYPVGLIHEDEFTTYKVLFSTDALALVNVPLYYYFENISGITQSQWTPKRLQQLDALDEQIQYFKSNGYRIAYTVSLRHLLQHCIKHLMYIKTMSPQYDYLIHEVSKRRTDAFRRYAAEVGLKKAFGYWYEVRIQTPMKRVLKNESAFAFLKRRIRKKFKRLARK